MIPTYMTMKAFWIHRDVHRLLQLCELHLVAYTNLILRLEVEIVKL
jgi:hypothetical protein